MNAVSVLIVDDDLDLAKFIKLKLLVEAPDFEIHVVGSAEECLEFLDKHKVDCILSDYQMPLMDGLELLQALQRQGRDIPFIFITGQGNEQLARDALKNGAYDYFTKDIGFAQFPRIVNSIRQSINKRRSEQKKKEAEHALQEGEELNRAIVNTVLDGIITINSDATVVSFNPAAEKVFGYSKSEVIGNNVNMLMPEPYHSEHSTYINNYLTTGQKKIIGIGREVQGRRKDGSVFPLALAVEEMRVEGKRMFTGVLRDITEKKKAEDALNRLASIVESSTDAIIGKTLDGTIFTWNWGAEKMYGYTAQEAIGKHISIIVPPDRKDELDEKFQILRRGGRVNSFETLRLRKDGEIIIVSLTISPIKDSAGNITGSSAIARDITESKKVEMDLRESEAKFKSLSEEAQVGIYLIQDMRFVYINPALSNMLGYAKDELLRMKTMLDTVEPGHRERAGNGISDLINRKENSIRYEGRCLKKDGDTIDVEGNAALMDFQGRPAIIGTVQDITERKSLERQKADFLAMITHDFKSPLTSISGYSELISTLNEGSETGRMAEAILQSADKLKNMVKDFLVYSKLESGKLAPELSPTNPGELLNEAKNEFEAQAELKRITLEARPVAGIPALYFDRKLIQRALSNLLQNALNFTPEGGRVVLKAELDEMSVAISVQDTGAGIPESEKDRIFEKYYSSPGAAAKKGTGLGLTIVKAVAEAHGGRVEVKSEVGKGSTFTIVLPAETRIKQTA